jgi:hypothetical protein
MLSPGNIGSKIGGGGGGGGGSGSVTKMSPEQFKASRDKTTREEMAKLLPEIIKSGAAGAALSSDSESDSSSSSSRSGGSSGKKKKEKKRPGSSDANSQSRVHLLTVQLASACLERDEALQKCEAFAGLEAAMADVAKLAGNVARIAREAGVAVALPPALAEGAAPPRAPAAASGAAAASPAGAAAAAPLRGAAAAPLAGRGLLDKAVHIERVLKEREERVRVALEGCEPALRAALARNLAADTAVIATAAVALKKHAESQQAEEGFFKSTWWIAVVIAILALLWRR